MNTAIIDETLAAIAADPVGAMDRQPPKRDAAGTVLTAPRTAFSARDVATRDYVLHRDRARQEMQTLVDGVLVVLEDVLPGRAPIELYDRASNLVDRLEHTTLASMEQAGLRAARLTESPWSSDYWPIYSGILAHRYGDPAAPRDLDWERNYEYSRDNPLHTIAAAGQRAALERLSPAEKYDLLMGDPLGPLTESQWSEGKAYHDASGQVESWMGICHGWAPAAYMVPRPLRAVDVVSPAGWDLRFYPADIKALACLAWAKANTVNRLIGGRCNDKDPATDPASGRVISPRAFDTNPGTWHLSVVNQIGVARRSFVIDATFDYEVWNQPVVGYEYHYFNPVTLARVPTLAEATVRRADFTGDRFKKYRGPAVAAVVGVSMTVAYTVETAPTHEVTDAPSRDAITEVVYTYDVELDAAQQIIGGEWYLNKHPDFLWTPPPGARATSVADPLATGEWPVNDAPPAEWRRAARRASGYGMPLAKVVDELVRRSRA